MHFILDFRKVVCRIDKLKFIGKKKCLNSHFIGIYNVVLVSAV